MVLLPLQDPKVGYKVYCKGLPAVSGIYQIVNTINQKRYIGYATNLKIRCRCHGVELRSHSHGNCHLQNSWNLYGQAAFRFEIIQLCDITKLKYWEHYWCTILNVHNREYGYNIEPTAPDGCYIMSEETKKKISIANKGRVFPKKIKKEKPKKDRKSIHGESNPFYNKEHTEDSRKLISESKRKYFQKQIELTGRAVSEESIKKSIETRKQKYKQGYRRAKPIIRKKPGGRKVIDIETGVIYNSCTEVANLTNIKKLTLSRMLTGKYTNTTKYRYIDKEGSIINVRTVRFKRVITEEHRQKISEKNKGSIRPRGINSPNYGRRHSEETLEKMKKSHSMTDMKMIQRKARGRKVVDDTTGIIYGSVAELSEIIGIRRGTLCKKLTGTRTNNTSYRYI